MTGLIQTNDDMFPYDGTTPGDRGDILLHEFVTGEGLRIRIIASPCLPEGTVAIVTPDGVQIVQRRGS